ncbi:MAG: hypothetical protein DUW69_002165 [Verrucomicrobia bacterium]|nr:MAG: hypothetical protein DUW69_002165 [Verrucomicrobiota bacterium]
MNDEKGRRFAGGLFLSALAKLGAGG